MPSWFKKVFSGDAAKPKPIATDSKPNGQESSAAASAPTPVSEPPSVEKPALGVPDTSPYDRPKVRKVVEAPVMYESDGQTGWSEEIRIKARVEGDGTSCVLLVDRPVLDGYSAWLPGSQWAEDVSPLAAELFKVKGVGSVLLHNMTVTVGLAHGIARPWEDMAAEVASVIREHLKAGRPVVTPAFVNSMPPEEEIRNRLQSCVDLEINPGIASHSGVITLERVEGNTVWITMGGGCQGCAASTITLRQGIHTSFRQTVPQIGAIYDATDHAAGENPFYSELPAGMA